MWARPAKLTALCSSRCATGCCAPGNLAAALHPDPPGEADAAHLTSDELFEPGTVPPLATTARHGNHRQWPA
ncbi:MAG: hypothetical protein U5Q16_00005, partial [Gammaproteobacteria bacterium]|nr:hypothetical protein [Gammaproteobacteria bacterium]